MLTQQIKTLLDVWQSAAGGRWCPGQLK